MNDQGFVSPDEIRAQFSRAMSDMYKSEVPLYGTLLDLVAETNKKVMEDSPEIAEHLRWTGEISRLAMERHGAIRVGTAEELATIRRLFAVMGMQPVGYYDLSPAGVPVHSTAFRAVHESSLQVSPFRVFTSLLRLELIENPELRELASHILAKRNIFTPRVKELIAKFEAKGGLGEADANEFVKEALETFRWHTQATVTAAEYNQLHDQHRLIADVVAFKGPHINHLTPRTLDIDQIQAGMPKCGITPKAVVEGPPRRRCPILLRQTSFKALQEKVAFVDQDRAEGSHTARFGEIEQRGAALTPKGRALYDLLLNATRDELKEFPSEHNAKRYNDLLEKYFKDFPDSHEEMRKQGLAFFRYFVTEKGIAARSDVVRPRTLDDLISAGHVHFEPLVYEDFLPVSAAGIFQSNLGDNAQVSYEITSNQAGFHAALEAPVLNELELYAATQRRSILECAATLQLPPLV
ncbi:2-oxoadipate dioxygenase/decarboxylase HglS [Metapseudomonas boanensis]|uniref:2-oxoadipate dioxygenase/decarboxylase n=1 Tax=Metapseudomonas boanensis TaxID=2822138 RepID=A0ABS5XBC5_9GAMM|nr:VOC family protein [Pseudomonas boanensis]MBT8764543.1 VOC family protein [Pseudomonas boanensis]